MNRMPAFVLLSGLLVACTPPAPPPQAAAPPPPPPAPVAAPAAPVLVDHFVDIRSSRCGALLPLSADDREDAAMFYLGYTASQSRSRSINVGHIPTIISLALNYCAADPNLTVAQAVGAAYRDTRGW